jgi:hypothetical protein
MIPSMTLPVELRTQVEAIAALQAEGVAVYTRIVDYLIASGCRDTVTLEQTLDGLLGFAGSDAGVQLYRRLCRSTWDVDPDLAVRAASAYREMWDPDELRPWHAVADPVR